MWEPNVELCKENLESLSIKVEQVFNGSKLPFDNNIFDIIINRHESFDTKEVGVIVYPENLKINNK